MATTEQRASIIELYSAYFNRAADADGIAFWENSFGVYLEKSMSSLSDAAKEQFALTKVSEDIATTDEYTVLYPVSLENFDFITAIYNTLLERVPDNKGRNFWVNHLNQGTMSRDEAIVRMIEGAKANTTAQGIIDAALIANKSTVSVYFVDTLQSNNVEIAKTAFDLVTSDLASIDAAKTTLNTALLENYANIGGNDEDSSLIQQGTLDNKISGSNQDDILTGGEGSDRIHGGNGNDTVIFTGTRWDYNFAIEDFSLKVTGLDSTDFLYNVENLQFGDSAPITVQQILKDTVFNVINDAQLNSELLNEYSPILNLYQDDRIPISINAFLDHSILFDTNEINNPIAFGKAFGKKGDTVIEEDVFFNDKYTIEYSLGLNLDSNFNSIDSLFTYLKTGVGTGNSYYLDFIGGNEDEHEDTWSIGSAAEILTEGEKGEWKKTFDIKTIENSDAYNPTVYGRAVNTIDGGKILQYYFYYLENDWRKEKGAGGVSIGGLHESDWEFMQIKLGADLLPQEFMASTHLYEASYRNPFDDSVITTGNHINAFSVRGGHGTYFTAGEEFFSSYRGVDARVAGELGLYAESSSLGSPSGFNATDSYKLVELTNDSEEYKWLTELGTDKDGNNVPLIKSWGRAYSTLLGISNPPSSPAFNGDDRWDSSDNWLGSDLILSATENLAFGSNYPDKSHKVLVDSDIYEIVNNITGEVGLVGLPDNQMKMNFLNL